MSRDEATFLDLAMAGQVPAEQIDDFIDRWYGASAGGELYAYLGMTKPEYELWLIDPGMLLQF